MTYFNCTDAEAVKGRYTEQELINHSNALFPYQLDDNKNSREGTEYASNQRGIHS
jgi:hypothetical protein